MSLTITHLYNSQISGTGVTPLTFNLGSISSAPETLLWVMFRQKNPGFAVGIPTITDSAGNTYGVFTGDGEPGPNQNIFEVWNTEDSGILGDSPLILSYTADGTAPTYDLDISVFSTDGLVPAAFLGNFEGANQSITPGPDVPSTVYNTGNLAATIDNSILLAFGLGGTELFNLTINDTLSLISSHYNLSAAFRVVNIGTYSSSWITDATASHVIVSAITLPIDGSSPPVVIFKPIVYIT